MKRDELTIYFSSLMILCFSAMIIVDWLNVYVLVMDVDNDVDRMCAYVLNIERMDTIQQYVRWYVDEVTVDSNFYNVEDDHVSMVALIVIFVRIILLIEWKMR